MRRIFTALALMTTLTPMSAQQNQNYHNLQHTAQTLKFRDIAHHMPASWYGSAEAIAAADSALKYQFPSGGWGKNVDWHRKGNEAEKAETLMELKAKDAVGATIDNGATTTEMLLLAKVYASTCIKKYRKAFIHGLEYLLEAQYDNGGWPQFYPFKPFNNEGFPFYSNHITFNDNAMYNVMVTLRDLAADKVPYDALRLPANLKLRAHMAFDKGIACILKCQIRKNGHLTVWCQQHDEHTLQPAGARSYELPSFTGCHETPALLHLLMEIDHPSREIVEAVLGAVEWLKSHTLKDLCVEKFINKEGQPDRRIVHRFGAKLWARYYDLDTEEPFVSDRDGMKEPDINFIGYERRIHYGWYGTDPQEVLDAFPVWLERVKSLPF